MRYTLTVGGEQDLLYINEGNLFRLIIESRKPEAQAFEEQVVDVILPTLRRTGRYAAVPPAPSLQPPVARLSKEQRGRINKRAWELARESFDLYRLQMEGDDLIEAGVIEIEVWRPANLSAEIVDRARFLAKVSGNYDLRADETVRALAAIVGIGVRND